MKFKTASMLLILGALIAVALPRPALCGNVLIDRIIARVNEEIITQRQFDAQKEQIRADLAEHYSGQELDERVDAASKNLLRDMIDQDLLVQKAKDLNMNADTELVNRLDQMRKQMGLASILDLQNEVEKQGLIWEDFQNNIRRRLLTQQVIEQQVSSRLIVTDADARKYFDEHKQQFSSPAGVDLAEVQISNEKWGAAVAKQRADAAYAMLQGGAKWEAVVKKYSDGPNANSGGDAGFFPTGTLIPEISKGIKNLDPGETSGLIPIQSGYIILKLLQQRSAGSPKYAEVAEQVKADLYQQKMQPALRDYLTTLRKESYIYLAPGFVDSGAVNPGAVGSAQEVAQEDR
ncbi:MAG: peptidyl-prolyl cis-trans isomerase [Acidobacteriota bacterium]|nr:peptidyl-prolyl cis-trans isomerase [Acidobacteriota bacterium]